MFVPRCLLVMLLAAACCGVTYAADTDLDIWFVDPLVKVFRDARPSAKPGEYVAEVARGEVATFQVVIASPRDMKNVSAVCSMFVPVAWAEGLAKKAPDVMSSPVMLRPGPVRFVGYVPVDRPIHTPPRDFLARTPGDYPDPLLEQDVIDVPAGAQPIWVTVPIAETAPPVEWTGTLTVTAMVCEQPVRAEIELRMRVYPALVGRARLWVTNWFRMTARHLAIAPALDTPEYWELLRRYARNMAAHRQNVALISALDLAAYTVKEDGTLAIDFARFDRWVEIFKEEGVIGRIEGAHIGGRAGDWESQFVVYIREPDGQSVKVAAAPPDSPEADRFYSQFLLALEAHLREKGWLDIYMQHVADEPIKQNVETYRAAAGLVRKYAPDLRIIEATHTKELADAIDVWVPQINFLHRDYEYYRQRQEIGNEVWFYTCIYPQAEYANRFIELPLIKTRLLHWINFRYGATGYLHWGWNQWIDTSPFTETTRPHGKSYLPAGDPWIVYPGSDGPLDSIRWEALRDGVADHELLSLLAECDPDAAMSLAKRLIRDFDSYETDVAKFRAVRHELLEALSGNR
ncbi:MAG: DUF4091 domain-containing protein [Phycisphaerae bacterium]|nr:DUF4091 domain-containing protein [Phycisphaerae bacterium]